ncbi:hypothetical protein NDN08_006022 [Rhodosorus marinus]|uniref:Gfo/Idh/MocA-like oxidoreductase N-terminal domain-containing protein n=1 Tax=Rhodosorus marinus TaxID=101924 RepID=A0AAV8UN47_9RHOD|nr:hypothetical protein NDN08_006022 [Rhodosorus marinus]
MEGDILVIGAGRFGKNHVRTLVDLGFGDQLIVCDSDDSRLVDWSAKGLSCVNHYRKALESDSVKTVLVVTPAKTHFKIASEALELGKDVFVEKPLCLSENEGLELQNLERKKGSILMVGHILNYDLAVQKLLDLLSSNAIGDPKHLKSNRLNFGTVRADENALWSLAVHDISLASRIFGGRATKVTCTGQALLGNVEDFVSLNLGFEGDRTATISVSWLHPYLHREMVIIGTEGFIVYDAAKPLQEQLKVFRYAATQPTAEQPKPSPVAIKLEHGYSTPTLSADGERALAVEVRHFLDRCKDREKPLTNSDEALDVLWVLEKAQKQLDAAKSSNARGSLATFETGLPPSNSGDSAVGKSQTTDISLPSPGYKSHSTAVIDEGAVIGHGTRIWHFSHVMPGAVIGDNCNIGQNVYIASKAVLGKNVKVQNNVSVYDGVSLADNVFVGPSVVFTNVKNPRSEVIRRDEFMHTAVNEGATIGANSTIVCGVEIGSYAFVGAGSVVTKDVMPFALVYGNPAEMKGYMTREGNAVSLEEGIEESTS